MLEKKTIEKYAPYGVWAFFAYFCFRYAIEIANGGNGWKTGDWLINYSAGPVRRGLTGTIFLGISELGIPLLWLTYAAQVAIYAVIFALVLKLYKHTERSIFWLLILFSPAFLLFSFYDIQGGFRKEIIVFSVFAFFCLLYARKAITQSKLVLVSALYALASLSHELTVFTLPFFIYLLYISAKDGLITTRISIIYSVVLIVISAVVLLFASLYKGDAALEEAICLSLTNRNLDSIICQGAISWLSEDTKYATSRVLNDLSYKSFFTPALFILSVLPLFFTTWWRKDLFVLLAVSIASISPLFVVAVDWGRWIYILSFMLFCLALANKATVRFSYKKIFFVAGVIYLTTWSIPHCCVGGVGKGFIGTVKNDTLKIIQKLKLL